MNDTAINSLVVLFWIFSIAYFIVKNYSKNIAKRYIKKIFVNNIQNNNQLDWHILKNELVGLKGLKIQA